MSQETRKSHRSSITIVMAMSWQQEPKRRRRKFCRRRRMRNGRRLSCEYTCHYCKELQYKLTVHASFKLRLRPRTMKIDMNGMNLGPLPAGKACEDVFGDFLRYMFRCTRKFIEDTHANGKKLWKSVERDLNFVLSHPNGWEGAQQSRMRRSAILGGLIPNNDEGKSRIWFVTEGEASMHACILSGLAADVLSVWQLTLMFVVKK